MSSVGRSRSVRYTYDPTFVILVSCAYPSDDRLFLSLKLFRNLNKRKIPDHRAALHFALRSILVFQGSQVFRRPPPSSALGLLGRVVFTICLNAARMDDVSAICFQADPIVQALFNNDRGYVGVVLVAGWPPQKEINAPYSTFIDSVKECFDPVDLDSDRPAVYLYPPQFLHVTIATFIPNLTVQEGGSLFESSREAWIELVSTTASQHPDWPTSPLQLEIDAAQIGTKAGILLWKETTGGLELMRTCLANEALKSGMKIPKIPGIIHSSFLRFSKVPFTDGATVQERFQSKVLPRLNDIFSQTFVAKDAKLVWERTPYMHIPNDSEHVYLTLPFTK
jgi:hypothetical protein